MHRVSIHKEIQEILILQHQSRLLQQGQHFLTMQVTTMNGYPARAIAIAAKLRDIAGPTNLALAISFARDGNGGITDAAILDGKEGLLNEKKF